MVKKSDRDVIDTDEMDVDIGGLDEKSSVEAQVRELLPRVNLKPILDRAQRLMQENPGITLAAAVGTGFVLGVTLFSRVGRMALAGMLGLGAELAMQKLRASYLEQHAG